MLIKFEVVVRKKEKSLQFAGLPRSKEHVVTASVQLWRQNKSH